MRRLTPKERLRVYEYALEIVTSSVCLAIVDATEKLYPDILNNYNGNGKLLKQQFPELENERKLRHKNYLEYWWYSTNKEIRKEFIREKLINRVKEIIDENQN